MVHPAKHQLYKLGGNAAGSGLNLDEEEAGLVRLDFPPNPSQQLREKTIMTTSGEVQRSIQRFQEFASDLIRSDLDTFGDRLAVFMHFCESDAFFSEIDKQMRGLVQSHFESWLSERMQTVGGMAGSGDLTFPVDLDARVAMQFEVLRRINSGLIPFLDFTFQFFSVGSGISEHVRALNEAVTKPMARELKHRLEAVLEQLPEDKRTEVRPTVFQVFHNVGSVVQQHASGSHINQTNITVTSELSEAFSSLRTAVAACEHDPKILRGYAETIDVAENLASEREPKIHVIKTLLRTLPAIGAVASLIDTILKIIS